ncbi:TetR/AcrR family transcriptional regulator [Izhakiella australiensis]|uniref:TetR/AcrR family transcriptional regulator n=1 Tax=Izhakiella australiensis TaxID=1926881 RepID=UPI0015926466|nr:TetR/AcrR family transcriptional regulator [Izhakiella australiensis]
MSKKAITHQRILDVAASQLSRDGLDRVSVAKVMKACGLTHGGFYAHFPDRDRLIAEALSHALEKAGERQDRQVTTLTRSGMAPLEAFITGYLSLRHLAAMDSGEGCIIAAQCATFIHFPPEAMGIAAGSVKNFQRHLRALSQYRLSEKQAFQLHSTLTGALLLARALNDRNDADEYLQQTASELIAAYVHG